MQSTTCRKCRCFGSLCLRRAERKKKVKVCSCWKSTNEMSSSRQGARMEQVFMGILQFSMTDLNSHTMRAYLFISRFRNATYLLMGMASMSIYNSKMSLRDQSYLIKQALRRVTIKASRKEDMIPAKLFLQQERNSLILFFRKRRDQKQDLKYSSKLFCYGFLSSACILESLSLSTCILESLSLSTCILESLSLSILLRSVERLMGAILNMEDSTFQMIFLIYLSSFCNSCLAERRRNCSPASFFMSEFTFTFDISCMMASSSSYSSSSNETVGYSPFSGLLPPDSAWISLDISDVMISTALGLSILRMKMSSAIFLLGSGSSLEKRSPRTDLL